MSKATSDKECSSRYSPLKKENVVEELHSLLDSLVVYDIKPHLGVILTQIESLGLPEKQEKAVKDLAKVAFYKHLNDVSDKLMNIYFYVIRMLEDLDIIDANQSHAVSTFGQYAGLPSITDRE